MFQTVQDRHGRAFDWHKFHPLTVHKLLPTWCNQLLQMHHISQRIPKFVQHIDGLNPTIYGFLSETRMRFHCNAIVDVRRRCRHEMYFFEYLGNQ